MASGQGHSGIEQRVELFITGNTYYWSAEYVDKQVSDRGQDVAYHFRINVSPHFLFSNLCILRVILSGLLWKVASANAPSCNCKWNITEVQLPEVEAIWRMYAG